MVAGLLAVADTAAVEAIRAATQTFTDSMMAVAAVVLPLGAGVAALWVGWRFGSRLVIGGGGGGFGDGSGRYDEFGDYIAGEDDFDTDDRIREAESLGLGGSFDETGRWRTDRGGF